MGLYAAFIDLTKAFDTVNHDGLWKILVYLGCSPEFLTFLRQLHVVQHSQVKHNGSLSGMLLHFQWCLAGARPGPHLVTHFL